MGDWPGGDLGVEPRVVEQDLCAQVRDLAGAKKVVGQLREFPQVVSARRIFFNFIFGKIIALRLRRYLALLDPFPRKTLGC